MIEKVCAKCHIELRPKRTDVFAIEMATWGPMMAYSADLWHCPSCGVEVVLGFAKEPTKVHWEDGFEDWLAEIKAMHVPVIEFWLNEKERQTHAEEVNS